MKWGLGIGDWGLGGWAHTPNPKPPTPNPQSPIPIHNNIYLEINDKNKHYIKIKDYLK